MKRLVLAGGGHAHVQVLRGLAQAPLPGVEVWVISPEALAPYSGMVPGWLAGRYRFEEIAIDVQRLAAAAGARWRAGEIEQLDPAARRLRLADGGVVDYDLLSLNVGSTLTPPPSAGAAMLPLRPLALLRRRFEALLEHGAVEGSGPALQVTAVGGGAAGFECLLAVLHRLRTAQPGRAVTGRLVSRSTVLLPGLAPAARRAAHRALERAGVELRLGQSGEGLLQDAGGAVLWATGAEAHAWQRDPARRGNLAVDAQGFVRIDDRLHSVSHPEILAAGDCASWPHGPLAKAGVHAVRMGPVLLHNLRAALQGADPATAAGPGKVSTAGRRHHPQRHGLALLATADGRAIASRGPFGAEGAWVWRWKDWIDRGFVGRFLLAPSPDRTGVEAPLAPGERPEAPRPSGSPGRSCPLHYRYRPEALAGATPESLEGLEVLYVVGGLYGNVPALDRVLELFDAERGRKALVFNGDFHWFDADPARFSRVQQSVLQHHALRGNVETELAEPDPPGDAGCGCAYPDWVDDGVVDRSNRILARLRTAVDARQRAQLATLPMWLRAQVGPVRLGLVHGDATSLAGWGFSQERLREPAHRAEVADWLERAQVDAFASSHTCLPVFQALRAPRDAPPGWILNNGAAGMPNFRGDPAGILTRVALEPARQAPRRFGVSLADGVVAEAIAIDFDTVRWQADFAQDWPEGSDADRSYTDRIVRGPDYRADEAVRPEE